MLSTGGREGGGAQFYNLDVILLNYKYNMALDLELSWQSTSWVEGFYAISRRSYLFTYSLVKLLTYHHRGFLHKLVK